MSDGTRLIVAEGSRDTALGLAQPSSSFVLSSTDDGHSWTVRKVFDRQDNMPIKNWTKGRVLKRGPCEPAITLLPDGQTLLLVARLDSFANLWQASSTDGGYTWTAMTETSAWAVYPQLLTLANGVVLLAAGRPSLGLWRLDIASLTWAGFLNLADEHNKALSSSMPGDWKFPALYASVNNASKQTNWTEYSKAYLGIVPIGSCSGTGTGTDRAIGDAKLHAEAKGLVSSIDSASIRSCDIIITYDRLANGNKPPPGVGGLYDRVFTMEATVTASTSNDQLPSRTTVPAQPAVG
jgi:hypothetical protein